MPQPYLHQSCVDHLIELSNQITFAQLSTDEAQAIVRMAQFQHWTDGAIISNFGDRLKHAPCYLVVEGNVSVSMPLPDGREPVVATVATPGCVVGADALFLATERYARYVAEGDVTCALFTTQSIEHLAQRSHEIAYKLMAIMGSVVYRNFRVSVKRLAIDAAIQLTEKEQFEGELEAAHYRAKATLALQSSQQSIA